MTRTGFILRAGALQAMTTLVAVVEMLRRGQWSMLRIENEYLNNASAYREVADVPVLLTFSEAVPEEKPARAGPQSTGLRLRHRSVCLISTFMVAMAAYVIFVAALGFNKGKL